MDPLAPIRQAVIEAINEVRLSQKLSPLHPDPLLQRLGDAFCSKLLLENRQGHFTREGIPPYLRYLLAGGRGFHRENVGSYETTGVMSFDELPELALRITRAMLQEQPPEDGHRRTLLHPLATHVGVGLAYSAHRLVMSHEVATQVGKVGQTEPFCRPLSPLHLTGDMPKPWKVAAVEVLWEPLPGLPPLAGSYSYPPRKAWYTPREFLSQTFVSVPGPLWVGTTGRFRFSSRAGAQEGVELLVLWGRKFGETTLYPLALGGCVILGGMPPESLLFWANLQQERKP